VNISVSRASPASHSGRVPCGPRVGSRRRERRSGRNSIARPTA